MARLDSILLSITHDKASQYFNLKWLTEDSALGVSRPAGAAPDLRTNAKSFF